MRKTDYLIYTHKELLQDDFFITSHFYPTQESIAFWNKLKKENNSFAREVDIAIHLLKATPFRDSRLTDNSKEELLARIRKTIRKKNRRRNLFFNLSSLVAASVLIVFIMYYYFSGKTEEVLPTGIEAVEKPASPVAQIQLIDNLNNELIIDSDEPVISHDKKGALSINSEKVERETGETTTKYNQLIIPPGKRSFLTLSDGTRIWVNANSRVVYPAVFDKKHREILIEGEAYLEVAHDSDKPFYVKTRDLQVEVLGTSFNVSAYEGDPDISVVLVTGKVNVNTKSELSRILSPNEMLSFENGEISIQTVDVNNYISWRKGTYTFRSERFSVILKRLSRYYNKEIIWSEGVEELKCGGGLNLKDDVLDLLNQLAKTVPIAFRENGDTIEVYVKP